MNDKDMASTFSSDINATKIYNGRQEQYYQVFTALW